VGAPPQVVRMNPTPTVGAAPLTVSFSTDAVALSGGSLSYAWDFDGDGVVDSTESSPEHTYPAGTAPGLYHAHLILTDEEQVSTEILTPVTVAAAPVAVSALATPNQRTELDGKADVANITLTLPAGALNEKMPIGLSGVSSDTLALLPAGAVVALFDIAPTNTTLAEPATVQVSVPGGNVTQDGVKVLYWDAASHAWFSDGIRKIRVTPGTPALVSFETTHFNTFIVASATTATPAGPCFIATAAYGTPLGGDIDALRAVRDRFLLDSTLGTAFVDAYYRVSPPIADAVAAHPALATLVRLMLAPVIWMSRLALAAPWALLLPMGLAFWGFRAGFRRI
jgi:PKD repeat protein